MLDLLGRLSQDTPTLVRMGNIERLREVRGGSARRDAPCDAPSTSAT
jgi:hypothetical protein